MKSIKLILLNFLFITGILAANGCQYYKQGSTTCIDNAIAAPIPEQWLPSPCSNNERLVQGRTSTCEAAVPMEALLLTAKPTCTIEGQTLLQGTGECVFTSNMTPVARAGNDQNVSTSSTVTLDGSLSSDLNNDPLTYRWTLVSKPIGSSATLSSLTTATSGFITDVDGTYVIQLVVNDGTVDSLIDEIIVTANTANTNTTPIANAGTNKNVNVSATVVLNGSGSTDDESDPLTYSWILLSKPEGSEALLSDVTLVNPTFVADVLGEYVIQLIVNDGQTNSLPVNITITAVTPDTEAPVITMLGDNPAIVLVNHPYTDAGATAVDNVDGTVEVQSYAYVNTNVSGTYNVEYDARDSAGNFAFTYRIVKVVDSLDLIAFDDLVEPITITQTSVDVLTNDTLPEGSTITVSLIGFDQNYNEIPVNTLKTPDGNWTVSGNTVTFTPNALFGGDQVFARYKIEDENGNKSYAGIRITFPRFFYAEHDQLSPGAREETTVNVLANDTFPEGSAITISLIRYDENDDPIYVNSIETSDGNWTVIGDTVVFSPTADFNGGYVYTNYLITDENGHRSTSWIQIEFPRYFYAEGDYVNPILIEETIVNVLTNDIFPADATITVLLQGQDITGNWGYHNAVITSEGNWTVVDNTVVFTPNANFGGGYVSASYQITDENGHSSSSWINIEFPRVFYAEYDKVYPTTIEETTVDVLANDTLPEGTVPTLLLQGQDITGDWGYHNAIITSEGNWTVVDNTVVFTPNANFGGGRIYKSYQITDDNGHTSTAGISIEFPKFFYAESDNANPAILEETTVEVLANDTYPDGAIITVLLQSYDENGNTVYVDTVTTNDGTWSVVDNSVVFTTGANFGGGYVYITYQITDEDGHISENSINIDFPVTLHAEYDEAYPTAIEDTLVDVLTNDTIVNGPASIALKTYDVDGNPIWVSTVEQYEGNWSIDGDNVMFSPNENAEGRYVAVEYQITDANGLTSSNSVQILFPKVFYAEYDYVNSALVEETTVDVLANDTFPASATISVLLEAYDNATGTVSYVETVETNEGNWSVVSNNVTFNPDAAFSDTYVQINYQISDENGHTSTNSIGIEFN